MSLCRPNSKPDYMLMFLYPNVLVPVFPWMIGWMIRSRMMAFDTPHLRCILGLRELCMGVAPKWILWWTHLWWQGGSPILELFLLLLARKVCSPAFYFDRITIACIGSPLLNKRHIYSGRNTVLGLRWQDGCGLHHGRSGLRRWPILRSCMHLGFWSCYYFFHSLIFILFCLADAARCFRTIRRPAHRSGCPIASRTHSAVALLSSLARLHIGSFSITYSNHSNHLWYKYNAISLYSVLTQPFFYFDFTRTPLLAQYEVAVVTPRESRIEGPFELRTDWTVSQYGDPEAKTITLANLQWYVILIARRLNAEPIFFSYFADL